uniref:Uncharacterized protein n=1 Tax=Oryza punctata TaxID=4537 RepID=A0A0E0L8Z2_ORYPU
MGREMEGSRKVSRMNPPSGWRCRSSMATISAAVFFSALVAAMDSLFFSSPAPPIRSRERAAASRIFGLISAVHLRRCGRNQRSGLAQDQVNAARSGARAGHERDQHKIHPTTTTTAPRRATPRRPPAPPATMSLAATFVFLLVSALQMLDHVLDLVKKRGSITDDQLKLRLEITQILKEASALSTPSTFAQAAKLKRLAAAKEKELAKLQQQDIKGKQSLYNQYGRVLLFAKDGCFPGEVLMLLQAVLWLEFSHGYF